jgi:hypothetical protein
MARIDTGSAGRGGTPAGERAVNLASIDDAMKKSPDLRSHLERDQDQRLKTAKFRTTHEDRRATTNPMELTFLASGTGEHQERRANAPVDPSRGSLVAPRASFRPIPRYSALFLTIDNASALPKGSAAGPLCPRDMAWTRQAA